MDDRLMSARLLRGNKQTGWGLAKGADGMFYLVKESRLIAMWIDEAPALQAYEKMVELYVRR